MRWARPVLLAALSLPALAHAQEATHVVKPGETLWRIATRNHTTVDALARANRISDVGQVRAGTELVLPGDALPAPAAEAEATVAAASDAAARPSPAAESPPASAAARPASQPLPAPEHTPRSWVLGASQVRGAAVAEMRLAKRDAGGPPPQLLDPSPGNRTIQLPRPRAGDDLQHEMEIEVGKSVFLHTDYAIRRVSVGNAEIVDVVVLSPTSVQLVARQIGGTNVILWDPQGRPQAAIDVHVGTVRSQLDSLLRRVLDGEDVRVESAGSGVALVGTVSNALAMEQALAVSKAFLGEGADDRVVNLLSVAGNQQVMLKVVVAEMTRSLERELGSNFAALIETDGKVFALASVLENLLAGADGDGVLVSDAANLIASFQGLGSLSMLTVVMEIVERNGLGKILAEPTLVARSGETASFLAGGEVPIPIAQGGAFGSITIEFKKFGVGVAFTPTVLGPDRIHLEVAPEVSEPDFSFGTEVDGTVVPGFITRRAATSVELKDGQSFAIAGLLSDVVREAAAKYPLLGDIPVLGALFRSTRFQKNETELVIIVTPQLVKPLGPPPHPLPSDAFSEPSALEFYLLGALEGRTPPEPRRSSDLAPAERGGLIGDAGHRLPVSPEEEAW
jgi:pilus assembly protein CpaC